MRMRTPRQVPDVKLEEQLQPILLIEDNIADARLLMRKFARARVRNQIIHLETGDKALAYVSGINEYSDRVRFPIPVLIILDLKLPGLSGLELLPVIRRTREWKAIPIVILTVDEDERVVRGAYELGANSYLLKTADEERVLVIAEAIRDYWLQLNKWPSLVIGESA